MCLQRDWQIDTEANAQVNSLDSWQLWSQQYDKGEYHGSS